MGPDIICLIFAFITLLVALVMAVCVGLCIPNYMVREYHISKRSNDTEYYIKERCNCTDDLDKEEMELKSRSDFETDKTEVMKLIPSIVTVNIKKYVDDKDERRFQHACTAVALTESHVLGGSSCLGPVKECNETDLIEMLRVRSSSQYWSIGGDLQKVKSCKINPDRNFVIFTLDRKFQFDKEFKKINYPGNQTDVTSFHLVGWELPPKYKYMPALLTELSTNPACKGKPINFAKDINAEIMDLNKALIATCSDLSGVGGMCGVVNLRHADNQQWILQAINASFTPTPSPDAVLHRLRHKCDRHVVCKK